MRGEYYYKGFDKLHDEGSPPLARGILCYVPFVGTVGGITPACAGNTILIYGGVYVSRDHPRLRGEYRYARAPENRDRGSPPLARGILYE